MVKLRLKRMGKKRQPVYKIVAVDSRAPRDGKYLEALGQYNPMTNPHTIVVDEQKALKWLGVGAQPTDTVRSLLRQSGILYKRQMLKKNFPEEAIEANMAKWRENHATAAPVAKKAAKAMVTEPEVEAPAEVAEVKAEAAAPAEVAEVKVEEVAEVEPAASVEAVAESVEEAESSGNSEITENTAEVKAEDSSEEKSEE